MSEHRQELVFREVRRLGLAPRVDHLGDVERQDGDPVDAAVLIAHRLVDDVEADLLRPSARPPVEDDAQGFGCEGLTARVDLVEQLVNALPLQFGHRFPDWPAIHGTVGHQRAVGLVGEFEHVVRTAQDGDGDRGVPEDVGEPAIVRGFDGPNLGPQQLRIDTRAQLPAGEWFDDVVVRAGFSSPSIPRLLSGAGGQHDDRADIGDLRIGAQLAQQLEAVEPRHHHVGADQVARPSLTTPSSIGPMMCQISGHISRPGAPSA